jgi:hypothetical protein
LKDVGSGESLSESGGQIRRQLLDQLIAISCLGPSSLFLLDKSPANFPIGRRDDSVYSPADRSPRFFEQCDDPIQQRLVWVSLRSFSVFRHVFPE